MSMAQLSPNSVVANPAHINPLAQTDQHAQLAKANEAAQQTIQKTKTDSVTISKQALMMSAQTNRAAEEKQENAAQKTYEMNQGKR